MLLSKVSTKLRKLKCKKKYILTHRKQDGNVTQSRETWIDVCVVFFKQRRICNNRGEVAAPIWRQLHSPAPQR